jgi:hypothetical protein
MPRMPDPVKGKKSPVGGKVAIAKATAATKSERVAVAPKSRYPQMSSASGAEQAAKRGAGAERSKMGGFGKTAARPMISNEGKVANQASRRKAIAGVKKAADSRSAAVSKASASDSARVKGMKKDTTGSSAGGFRKADQASSKGVKPMTSRAVSSRQAEDQVVARRKVRNSAGSAKKITRLPSTK